MNQTETTAFVEKEIGALFPKWQPTDRELWIWMDMLKKQDYSIAKRAIAKVFELAGRFNAKPVIRDFKTQYYLLPQPEREAPLYKNLGGHVFVQYYGGGKAKMTRGCFHSIKIKAEDVPNKNDIAESYKRWLVRHYGGEWRIFANSAHDEMIKMRFEMRGLVSNEQVY